QYWKTINVEQGGHFDLANAAQSEQMDAIAAYVNYALPYPKPPTTDSTLVAQGSTVFTQAGCASCHSGDHYTDSGAGNPTLDLSGTVLVHDVGSWADGDVDHTDFEGHPRTACAFDTPELLGIAASAPYMHDGSAPTLDAVVTLHRQQMGDTALSASDQAAL